MQLRATIASVAVGLALAACGGGSEASGRDPRRPSPRPVTDVGDLQPEDRTVVRRVIQRRDPYITYCYERELAEHPTLGGIVRATFDIGSDGLVSNVGAHGVDSEVAFCIKQLIESLYFPLPSRRALTVRYPFSFVPTRIGRGGTVRH